jgi:hypothetical protein
MKIQIQFEITDEQFKDLLGAIGYSKKIIDIKTGKLVDNKRTEKEVLQDALKEHTSYFLDMFVKQRVHTEVKKKEDKMREKELKPLVEAMKVNIN